MTVKVRRKVEALGTQFEATVYLPEDMLLTRPRREKADKLDNYLKAEVQKVNSEFDRLDDKTKKVEIEKWRWLGKRINDILESLKSRDLVEQPDIDNHHIWPAIGQYLRKELSRGLEDRKRSGTKNDHYRKCWALYALPGTGWVTSWVGWDAFTDRGDQLAYSKKLLPLLEERFTSLKGQLKPEDFKEIAKIAVSHIPTHAKAPKDIDSMPDSKLAEVAADVYREFVARSAVT